MTGTERWPDDELRRRADRIIALEAEVERWQDQAQTTRIALDRAQADRQGAVEDARDAGEASMQAAFWRARAIELGASEDEYRKAHP